MIELLVFVIEHSLTIKTNYANLMFERLQMPRWVNRDVADLGTTEADNEVTQARAKATLGRRTSARQARLRAAKQRRQRSLGSITERGKAAKGRGATRGTWVQSALYTRGGQGEGEGSRRGRNEQRGRSQRTEDGSAGRGPCLRRDFRGGGGHAQHVVLSGLGIDLG